MEPIHEINEIIASLIDLSGIGVCFYDLTNFFDYSRSGKHEHSGHYCELCRNVKLLEGGRAACDRSDRGEAMELACAYREPFFYKCHMGMCELIVPIYHDDRLRGMIFLGQCRVEGETSAEDVAATAAGMGGSAEQFARLHDALPSVSRSNLLSMGKIVQLYFKNLSEVSSIFANSVTDEPARPLHERIAVFVEKNYMRPITPRSISERFFINQSYMARLVKRECGCTVTELINRVRCKNAARLLKNSGVPVNSIALNVGYSDANYFSRVFAGIYGVAPSEYRRADE